MDKVRQDYKKLLVKFSEQQAQIDNLSDLYIKFKNLKEYEQQYDRNQQLKKQLEYWSKTQKTPRELQLEQKIAMLSQYLSLARDKLEKGNQSAQQKSGMPQRIPSLNSN